MLLTADGRSAKAASCVDKGETGRDSGELRQDVRGNLRFGALDGPRGQGVATPGRVRSRAMERPRVTVKEIARLAGVSIGTVDRVLHDRAEVSTETRAKIHAIIAKLGYEPNVLARQLAKSKVYTFRAILPRADQDSGYWALCLAGIRRAEADLARYGAKVTVDEFDRYDHVAYSALLKDVVANPGDGLLIAPVLPERLGSALQRLQGGGRRRETPGTPYVFFDCDAVGTQPVAAIVQNAGRAGYLAGRMMSLLAKGPGPLVAVSAHAGDRHIGLRIDGFGTFFREGGGSTGARRVIVAECPELETTKDFDRHLASLVRAQPRIAGILVANASGHVVGDWLVERGEKEGCAVVSWDLVHANVEALRDGRIDCVISQRPAEQAREGLERLFKAVVHGERDSSPASFPLEVYFKENVPQRDPS